jgi:ADP-ribosyl-[dinitrogen reductase] hydrolase
MALALGRSIIRRGNLDTRDVCEEFAAWLKTGPAFDFKRLAVSPSE